MEELQHQYSRLEHIARGANQALDNCGPGNILREIAKRANRLELDQARRELDQVRTEKTHLHAQVSAMVEELSQKSEELRKYHAEQTAVLSRMVGNPVEIVNKAHMYDRMMASGELAFAKQALPNRNPVRGGRRGRAGPEPSNDCWT